MVKNWQWSDEYTVRLINLQSLLSISIFLWMPNSNRMRKNGIKLLYLYITQSNALVHASLRFFNKLFNWKMDFIESIEGLGLSSLFIRFFLSNLFEYQTFCCQQSIKTITNEWAMDRQVNFIQNYQKNEMNWGQKYKSQNISTQQKRMCILVCVSV